MKKLPVAFVVENDPYHKKLYRELKRRVRVIKVLSLWHVERLFEKNLPVVSIVVMCGNDNLHVTRFDTIPLIKMMREKGFKGPILAVSHESSTRMEMCKAGCSHDERWKDKVPWMVLDILAKQKQNAMP